jgi:hypothetical protein
MENSSFPPSPARPLGKTDQVNVDMEISHQYQSPKKLGIFFDKLFISSDILP